MLWTFGMNAAIADGLSTLDGFDSQRMADRATP